jgi:hypothetical protein
MDGPRKVFGWDDRFNAPTKGAETSVRFKLRLIKPDLVTDPNSLPGFLDMLKSNPLRVCA